MYTDNNNKYRSRKSAFGRNSHGHHNGSHKSTWERFVSACSVTLGGFYRADGTIFRDPDLVDHAGDLDTADLNQRTHLRLRHQETLRQMNIEAITSRAYAQIDNSTARREIDQDWVNLFFSYAQDIGNASMQDLWGRAMALEICSPGSISKHSLAYLRHCDAWELKAFRKVAASAFIAGNGHPFIFRAKSHVSATDPIFTEHRLLSHCISAGLVDDTSTPLTAGFRFTFEGESQVVTENPFMHGDRVGYYVQRFTRIGSDLYRLLIADDQQAKLTTQKRVVWDFLTDYLELSAEETDVVS